MGNLKTLAARGVKTCGRHLPAILQGTAIVLSAAGIALAVYGTRRAEKEIREKKQAAHIPEGENLTKKDTVKIYAKHLWPSGIAFAGSAAAGIGSLSKSRRASTAAIAAAEASAKVAAESSKRLVSDYREEIKKSVDPEKAKEIDEAVMKKEAERTEERVKNDLSRKGIPVLCSNATIRFQDEMTGRFFYANKGYLYEKRDEFIQDIRDSQEYGSRTHADWLDSLGLICDDVCELAQYAFYDGFSRCSKCGKIIEPDDKSEMTYMCPSCGHTGKTNIKLDREIFSFWFQPKDDDELLTDEPTYVIKYDVMPKFD